MKLFLPGDGWIHLFGNVPVLNIYWGFIIYEIVPVTGLYTKMDIRTYKHTYTTWNDTTWEDRTGQNIAWHDMTWHNIPQHNIHPSVRPSIHPSILTYIYTYIHYTSIHPSYIHTSNIQLHVWVFCHRSNNETTKEAETPTLDGFQAQLFLELPNVPRTKLYIYIFFIGSATHMFIKDSCLLWHCLRLRVSLMFALRETVFAVFHKIGKTTSQLVQDFFHQQYGTCRII